MKTYPYYNKNGKLFTFEVDNVYTCPKKIAELLLTRPNITEVQLRKSFSKSSDVHLKFKYKGIEMIVWEPFGDSSRYWIGPESNNDIDISLLKGLFYRFTPNVIRKAIGDVLTLKFLKNKV